jgi:hypothetical protein
MMTIRHIITAAVLLASSPAWAALPVAAPTPAQQQAAAAKKAAADAQAAKDQESLSASMDAVSSRWRSRAAQHGWETHPPVAVAAAATSPAASAGIVTTAGAGGQQGAPPPSSPANPIIKSEKYGTAPPSEDEKAGPTRAQPRNASPTVQKGSPEGVSRK